MKRGYIFVYGLAICILIVIPIPWLHGSVVQHAAYYIIENSGTALTSRPTLNFVSGTTCVDNAGSNRTDCTSSGGSGATGPGGGITAYSSLAVTLSAGSTVYVPFGGDGAGSGTEASVQMKIQPSILVQGACLSVSVAPGTGNSLSFTLRDNGANTAITATISGASSTSACDSTDQVTTTSGDLLDWALTPSGIIAGYAPNVMISAQSGYSSGSGGGASYGAFSSIATCNSGASGDSYGATDIPLFAFCNGTSWAYWVFGRPVQLPSAASFTSQSCSTGCTLTTNGIAYMNIATINSTNPNLHGRYISLPSTPFTVDACFTADFLQLNSNGFGIYQSDGTKWQAWYVSALNTASAPYVSLAVNNYSSNTAFAAAQLSGNPWFNGAGQVCLRWHDDGTNIEVYSSLTGSNAVAYSSTDPNWTEYGSFSRTSYLTPTQIGWFGDVEQTTRGGTVTLFHWYSH